MGRRAKYAKGLKDYEPLYDTGERAIKRWVKTGREANPPELPPLDQPELMAAWWRRHMAQRVPAKLLALERVADLGSAEVVEPSAEQTVGASGPAGEDKNQVTPINLQNMEMDEGEAVRQARGIAKANYKHVEEATGSGKHDDYRRWFPIWAESAELMRKLEKEDRDARKASGSLISRSAVLGELGQLLEALRLMREAMPARVVARLGQSDDRRLRRVLRLIDGPLRDAIAAVRDSESAIFQNLESMQSPGAVSEALI